MGPFDDPARLPPRVAALRVKILEACASGMVEALAVPIQWAETPPVFSRGPDRPRGFADIVGFLKRRSFDGEGREMVAILRAVFEQPFVALRRGPFESYGWPAAAWIPLAAPTPEARAALWRCVRFADLSRDDAALHRAVIGADGTWHSFLAGA
ncbi:MAG: hypothetical protein JNK46_01035 [Methylobacteriaceae bacterium]|nr:hypothetical protein [Methylobacteriaceae bacterium]